jgi:hypothetical protein
MGAPLYPNTGTNWLAQLFRTAMAGCLVDLFQNNISVQPGTILSNLHLCDYSGYGQITVANLLPPYIDPAGGSSTRIPTEQFEYYVPESVASVTVTAGGTGYTSAPTVTFTGGGGSGATGTAVLTATAVTSVTITNGGQGYTSAPTVTFSGGGGTGATGTAVLGDTGLGVVSYTVTAGGSLYTTPPVVGFTGGGGTGAVAEAVITGGVVTGINVINAGSGYTSAPTIALTGGGGSGATATATLGHQQNTAYGFVVREPGGVVVSMANFDAPIPMGSPFDAIPLDVVFRFPN